MTPGQTLSQLRFRTRLRTWPGTANVVFGSVHVTHGATREAAEEFRVPLVLFEPGDDNADAQLPDRIELQVRARLVVAVAGDILGENALLGANRPSADFSEGKGLLEVDVELKAALKTLLNLDGIRIVARKSGSQKPGIDGSLGYVVAKLYNMVIDCTDEPYYHPPIRLLAVDAGGGDVTLTWQDPPTRFDSRALIIRRAVGAVPPATSTDGDAVGTPALGVETFTDSPGAGTFSYAIFMAYTDTGEAADQSFSDQEIGTTRASVVVA